MADTPTAARLREDAEVLRGNAADCQRVLDDGLSADGDDLDERQVKSLVASRSAMLRAAAALNAPSTEGARDV